MLLRVLVPIAVLLAACSGGGSSGKSPGPPGGGKDVLSLSFKGQKRVLFVVAEFLDAPALFSKTPAGQAAVQDLATTLATSYLDNSGGALALEIDTTWPPVLIQKATSDYLPATALVRVRGDALEAARHAGWDADSYDREVIFAPDVWPGKGRGWVRTAWMPNVNPWVLFHEVGHTLAWGHANFWDGDPTSAGVPGAGAVVQYGDVYDPMGTGTMWTGFHRSGPWFAQRAGWISDSQVVTVTQSGTYTIGALDQAASSGQPIALRIRRDEDNDYWVFYRSDEEPISGGAVLVLAPGSPFQGSLLLDMKPGSAANEVRDVALLFGETFDDSAATAIVVQNLKTVPGAVTLSVTVDAARQAALDVRPIIGVTSPDAEGEPLSGVVQFEVVASDPEVGSSNGDGIQRIDFEVLDPIMEPPVLIAAASVIGPPFVWSFDTTGLVDTNYYLGVKAVASDGGGRRVLSRFLVDNSSLPATSSGKSVTAVGWVRGADGDVAPGLRVEVTAPALPGAHECQTQGEVMRWSTTTDAAGCYVVEDLPAGLPLEWCYGSPDGPNASRGPIRLPDEPMNGVVVLPDVAFGQTDPEGWR